MKYINLIASMCLLSHCHVHSTPDAFLWGHSNKSNVVLKDLLRQNNSWCCTLILKKLHLTFPATTGNYWFQKAKKNDSLKTLVIYTKHCNTSSSKKIRNISKYASQLQKRKIQLSKWQIYDLSAFQNTNSYRYKTCKCMPNMGQERWTIPRSLVKNRKTSCLSMSFAWFYAHVSYRPPLICRKLM